MSDHFPDGGKKAQASLPARVVVDRHIPTGIVTYGYTDEMVRAYAAEQVAAERERCAQIVREAWEVHGLCCSDAPALADLLLGLGKRPP